MTIIIRDAVPNDAELIARFNSDMAMETESRTLAPNVIRRGVEALLTDPAKGRYWLAVDGDTVIGQVMATREWSDWRNAWFWWLQSVYIAKSHRRQGVFRELYDHVTEAARADGAAGLRLYVEHHNHAAIHTYQALGMSDAGYTMMETTFD